MDAAGFLQPGHLREIQFIRRVDGLGIHGRGLDESLLQAHGRAAGDQVKKTTPMQYFSGDAIPCLISAATVLEAQNPRDSQSGLSLPRMPSHGSSGLPASLRITRQIFRCPSHSSRRRRNDHNSAGWGCLDIEPKKSIFFGRSSIARMLGIGNLAEAERPIFS